MQKYNLKLVTTIINYLLKQNLNENYNNKQSKNKLRKIRTFYLVNKFLI